MQDVLARKKKAFMVAVQDQIAIIQARTQKGIDADGSGFAPYTPKYREKRARNNDQTEPPNLTVKGNMLASIRLSNTRETPTGISTEIVFGSDEEARKARGNMKKRKFFALSDEQKQDIINDTNEG
jgi:hypothetical protein